ncbi:hypothetical protein BLNAU_17578 [Blattamonas nauphoetae]|uniref:Uncharacterized protein n=1 Tax=Blattamonas nauphoetae TaxID=2049346 RepID=A0ABQ9X6U9_9EUKA|nr:hypothetical protein BLNAU_17578 [Blattamonas nauphoetae]
MAQALTPRGFEDRKTIHSTPVALTALSPLAIPFAIRASSCDNDAVNANPDTESAAEGAGKLLHGSLATWLSSSLFAVFQVITESVNVTHFSQPNSINMQAFSSSSPPLASRILIIFLSVRAEPHLYLFTISSALVLFFKASLPRRVSLVEMKRLDHEIQPYHVTYIRCSFLFILRSSVLFGINKDLKLRVYVEDMPDNTLAMFETRCASSRILAELPLMEPIQCFPHVILEVPLRLVRGDSEAEQLTAGEKGERKEPHADLTGLTLPTLSSDAEAQITTKQFTGAPTTSEEHSPSPNGLDTGDEQQIYCESPILRKHRSLKQNDKAIFEKEQRTMGSVSADEQSELTYLKEENARLAEKMSDYQVRSAWLAADKSTLENSLERTRQHMEMVRENNTRLEERLEETKREVDEWIGINEEKSPSIETLHTNIDQLTTEQDTLQTNLTTTNTPTPLMTSETKSDRMRCSSLSATNEMTEKQTSFAYVCRPSPPNAERSLVCHFVHMEGALICSIVQKECAAHKVVIEPTESFEGQKRLTTQLAVQQRVQLKQNSTHLAKINNVLTGA